MQIKKVSYSESIKKPMQKFESRLISVSCEAELTEFDDEKQVIERLKAFVRGELAKD